MPLEATDYVDIITGSPDGRIQLVITDSGITTDPDERLRLLVAKVQTYVTYIRSDSFKAEHPGKGIDDCDIVVMTRFGPTESMSSIQVPGISVTFTEFDPEAERAKRSKEPVEQTQKELKPSTLLFKASLKNDLDLMKEAVEKGAQINQPNAMGLFAIEYAVHFDNVEMLEYLFASGAEFPDKTFGGKVLWVSAHVKGYTKVKEILVRQGCKPGFGDKLSAILVRLKTFMQKKNNRKK